jgi:hypothetical protein
MDFICYLSDGHTLDIQPGDRHRSWMDATPEAFAYRCLPLSMANLHGWEIRCDASFEAEWNGGPAPEDVRVTSVSGREIPVESHFGSGILTFRIEAILRTPPRFNLWITGPPNTFKDGIQPLSALVETDWMPYTFTMNWQFTRPRTPVQFSQGEPYCFLFPVPRGLVEAFEPEFRLVESDKSLAQQHRYAARRRHFSSVLRERKPGRQLPRRVVFQGWYTNGMLPDGSSSTPEHQRGLAVHPFSWGHGVTASESNSVDPGNAVR